jgi:nucleoside-diphosphate-sugar epimerase
MQTILGAGGVIGSELAKALKEYTQDIRLVSRHPQIVNESDQIHAADLSDPAQTAVAIRGSKIVYLTIGLPYKTKIWQQTWPLIMHNVIEGCKIYKAKLVFFDNMYMYDPAGLSNMTEENSINPPSKKGKVRAEIARMLLNEIESGHLNGLIARSADFYGPGTELSLLVETVFKNFKQGKKANWFCSTDFKHSFTYTPDAGKATALLGNSDNAYNQIWHLPTDGNHLTGKQWIAAIAKAMIVEPRYQVLNKSFLKILGLINKDLKELGEMLYQYDRDYVFNSSKFEKTFDLKPTHYSPHYSQGIKQIIDHDLARI